MKWIDRLTEKERRHLEEVGNIKTKQQMRETRQGQKALDPIKEVCWTCRQIAVKLGIEAKNGR